MDSNNTIINYFTNNNIRFLSQPDILQKVQFEIEEIFNNLSSKKEKNSVSLMIPELLSDKNPEKILSVIDNSFNQEPEIQSSRINIKNIIKKIETGSDPKSLKILKEQIKEYLRKTILLSDD